LAAEFGIEHIETSARDGLRVEDCFLALAKRVKTRIIDTAPKKDEEGLDIAKKEKQPSKKWCTLL